MTSKGVRTESGETIYAPIIVCNASPGVAVRILGEGVDSEWKRKVESIPCIGASAKVNIAMTELPNFKVRPGTSEAHHLAEVDIPLTRFLALSHSLFQGRMERML